MMQGSALKADALRSDAIQSYSAVDSRLYRLREDGTMKATTWQGTGQSGNRTPSLTAVLLAASIMLAQCAAVPVENAREPGPPANYGVLVANQLKTFKGFADYSNFAISGLRWIDTASGPSWIACVRYLDHGRQRYYSFFLQNGSIIRSRYDVRTDQCATQQYVTFEPATGTITAAAMPQQPVTGPAPPSLLFQQPIY